MKDQWILVLIIIVIIVVISSLKKKSKLKKSKFNRYENEKWRLGKEQSLRMQEKILYEELIEEIPKIKKSENKLENLEITSWPFYQKKPLTNPEQVLYYRLIEAIPEYIVLSQVQLSRFLGVKKGFNFNEWNNRINRMSVDFLICLKDSSIIAAIELDDKTHEREDRIQADEKKNKALADAGVRLIRWNVKNMPNIEAIKKELNY